jgi:ribosome biogenesis GTPase A
MILATLWSLAEKSAVRAFCVGRGAPRPAVPLLLGRAFHSSTSRFMADGEGKDDPKKRRHQPKKKKKWTLNKDLPADHAEKLAAAFDELARKEGFDPSLSVFADESKFSLEESDDETDDVLRNLEDPDWIDEEDDEGDDDDFLDFGGDNDDNLSMAERIAAAKRDMDVGSVSISNELDTFAKDASADDLRELGYRQEANPFGDDETPRKERFELVTNAMVCSACGSDFQSHNDQRPGYLPPDKFETQAKLSKIEEMQRLVQKKGEKEWSTEDEVEWLIQTGGGGPAADDDQTLGNAEIDAMAEEMGLDLVELSEKKTICKRCHGLQNFGKVDEVLRPGWTKEPLLAQESFRELLRPLRDKPAVIIALVDLFDFAGSVLPELDSIAGENPVILAANKADLLPSKMGQTRVENWVRRELEYLGVRSIANIGGAVRLVSCKTGSGVQELLDKARKLADEMDCDIYVVGAANAGKSTLLNKILRPDKNKPVPKRRAGNQNARRGSITTSPLPGTTLKFIQVKLEGGRNLYDTPGLLVPGTITQLLTPEELKMVVPTNKVEPITFRIEPGKCVLVGGLAKVEVMEDSKPFMFTFFVANSVKLHPTDTSRATEFIQKHAGEMLTPPLAPGPERIAELGEFEEHILDIQGMGWKEAAADISLTGLGWVAVTGPGDAKIKISVPKGIGVLVRPPLMPFDVWEVASKYTGGRAVRKSSKSASGKRRKGVGRR